MSANQGNVENAEDPLQGHQRRTDATSFLCGLINNLKSMKLALLLCQLVSLLIALTGVTNTQLNTLGVNIPTGKSLGLVQLGLLISLSWSVLLFKLNLWSSTSYWLVSIFPLGFAKPTIEP